ncbi:DUF421 domain-containing protein [Spirosoma taeanense]|uniref:DUF421 domain-containing protein n=1 Tax=Spirosoma taeanense TaxID=2735870 RepID=A0A6M5Y4X5_9BACT|nr:YetF domain-containing protein [Spirosoma taeanense]QJW89538.1 DUF421 domain-containing protein [Spirosoma taeanense]
MKKEEIRLDDWERILFGMAPPEFLFETLIRSLIIYFFLLVVLRLLGKRMTGQLTLTEMAVMVTIGAVISPSFQAPDRGIAMGILAMLCTLLFQRGTTLLAFDNNKIEQLTQGETNMLIKDGILQLVALTASRISRQELFARLRGKNIYKVSKVKRLYMEASGIFSIYLDETDKPGLSTLPPNDEEIRQIEQVAPDTLACTSCGNTTKIVQEQQPCSVCNQIAWTTAVL